MRKRDGVWTSCLVASSSNNAFDQRFGTMIPMKTTQLKIRFTLIFCTKLRYIAICILLVLLLTLSFFFNYVFGCSLLSRTDPNHDLFNSIHNLCNLTFTKLYK